ncbi:MAG: hypothetical protein Q8R55_07885, partial [Candidatus Taylorbacteria bacterium]|nr:hypothetical protein [Candidatus Taylorbacteria bacterium]
MTDKNGFNGVFQEDAKRKRERSKQHIEVTARQYFRMVQEDPKIAQLSLSRLWEIIENAGVVQLSEEEQLIAGIDTGYDLFRQDLFGVDGPIYHIVEHIKVGHQRGSTGKQIPVIVGPPGAG